MTSLPDLFAAFMIGLLASTHCIVMCGGISATLGIAGANRITTVALFSFGRVVCYGFLGLVFGALAELGAHYLTAMTWMRFIAGLLLIGVAGYIGGWWMGLKKLEAAGQYIWRYIAPVGENLLPAHTPGKALVLGVLWGFLPCGLIYSTLIWASLQAASSLQSAALMIAFGLGTLPAMVGVGFLGQRLRLWTSRPYVKTVASILLLGMGLWTMAAPWLMSNGHGAHVH